MFTRNIWLVLAVNLLAACGGLDPAEEEEQDGVVDDGAKADSLKKAKLCGGIAGLACPKGYYCQLDGDYPDAAGKCVKTQTCANVKCGWGLHCEMKGINGGAIPVCLKDAQITCANVKCGWGTHCEMKGINGGAIPVCLND